MNSESSSLSKQYQHNPILPPVVLSFAGSDPTAGAGIQADVLTLVAIGCHPATVITNITVQDTVGVSEIHTLGPELIAHQAQAILEDMPVAAFKIGLLGSSECVRLLSDILEEYNDTPVIFDPVLSSATGESLISDDILEAVFEDLIPKTMVLTPNTLEARQLVSFIDKVDSDNMDMDQCAKRLLHYGCEYVLITGTHDTRTHHVINTLYQYKKGKLFTLNWERLPASFHGSGCTLASAIAGYIAHGIDTQTSIKLAQQFTWKSLQAGYRIGMGQSIPHRYYWRNESIGEPLNTLEENILETSYPGH